MSLNFRPTHTCSTRALRTHRLLVLLGLRPSIASILRLTILGSQHSKRPSISPLQSFSKTVETLANCRSAPCYLILCDGSQTTVIEKDLETSNTRTSQDFIVHTNHDIRLEGIPQPSTTILGMEALVEESEERRDCIQKKWDRHCKNYRNGQFSTSIAADAKPPAIGEQTLKSWVKAYPIKNECTHFACIMDQKTAQIRWLERGELDP